MKIRITSKNIEVTGAIKEYAEKKLERMDKYFENEENATVTIATEKADQVVEVQVNSGATVYRAEAREADLYASFDKVIDILEGQVRKTKAKNDKKMKSESLKDKNFEAVANETEVTGEIVKNNYYSVRPISVEDAKLKLESNPKSQFFTFVNIDTNEVNVIFKTKDGKNFGLVEAE